MMHAVWWAFDAVFSELHRAFTDQKGPRPACLGTLNVPMGGRIPFMGVGRLCVGAFQVPIGGRT